MKDEFAPGLREQTLARAQRVTGKMNWKNEQSTRVMIAGVGYHNLSDLSLGPVLVPQLQHMEWSPGIEIDDWSFGPLAVVQRLEDQPNYYDRLILISAVERGRAPGAVHAYRWQKQLPDADEIQQRIGEAIMGVISLDNLLIIGQHFGVLPEDVIVIEVEPEDLNWGEKFTARVQAALPRVIDMVRAYARAWDG
ncbi:MAG: hydrogenase maturation protease [Chloroflexi bacterium]|nr:hydrogenase maturation protease [Chloroflexota bacterium]